MMNIKLNFEDFKLDEIQQTNAKGGGVPSQSTCTDGDDGCCDDSHNDDTMTLIEKDGHFLVLYDL